MCLADNANTRDLFTLLVDMSLCYPESKKAEIDTAAPFASVKAALTLFGERVERKPQQQSHQTQIPSVEVSTA
jgi:hypothetical protein